jgi:hypothetical protein
VLSADGIFGYQSAYYAIVGRPDGTVRLRFQSAEATKDGVKTARSKARELPFALPERRQHVRLIYLVRQSRSDHKMAIVASRSLAIINTLTERLKDDPKLCTTEGEVFCSWVPAGVAVRRNGRHKPSPLALSCSLVFFASQELAVGCTPQNEVRR